MPGVGQTQSSAPVDPHEKRWYVYCIECTAKSGRVTVHIGIALNVHKRLQDHRDGKVKATRGRSIRLLGYTRNPKQHGDALAIEAMLKKLTAEEKREFARRWER
jgi:predicted GIY-YIG superfamily endonuclease